MKLFNFIKKRSKTPEQIFRHLVEHIPTSYTAHHQFKNYIEFLEHSEWELALDSLIELANEAPEYAFPEAFWLGLAEAADKMDLDKTREYCKGKFTGTTF